MKILTEGKQQMSMSTSELARHLHIQPQSLRSALCREGSYYGVSPGRLPNGRLAWPGDALERLTKSVVDPTKENESV